MKVQFSAQKKKVLMNRNFIRRSWSGFFLRARAAKKIFHEGKLASIVEKSTYWDDGFATSHWTGFAKAKSFLLATYKAKANTPYLENAQYRDLMDFRFHTTQWAASVALEVEGDFVEIGVNYGLLSRSICEHVNFRDLNRKFFLVDPWGNSSGEGYDPVAFEAVELNFKEFRNVVLVRGSAPEALQQIDSEKIAYLALDINDGVMERQSLEILWPRIAKGGVVYFDDIGWAHYEKLRDEIERFLGDKPEQLLFLASGNAILIKA